MWQVARWAKGQVEGVPRLRDDSGVPSRVGGRWNYRLGAAQSRGTPSARPPGWQLAEGGGNATPCSMPNSWVQHLLSTYAAIWDPQWTYSVRDVELRALQVVEHLGDVHGSWLACGGRDGRFLKKSSLGTSAPLGRQYSGHGGGADRELPDRGIHFDLSPLPRGGPCWTARNSVSSLTSVVWSVDDPGTDQLRVGWGALRIVACSAPSRNWPGAMLERAPTSSLGSPFGSRRVTGDEV